MLYLLADFMAPWGQAAAILLSIYMFIYILIGLAVAAALMFGFAWVREKAELIKKIRPTVESVNATFESANKGTLPPVTGHDNKIVRAVAQVPMRAYAIEKKIDEGSDRVAGGVIEFRARTVQVQQILKAFFLPGLTRREEPPLLARAGVDFKSPGYRILMEQASSQTPTAGDGYSDAVGARQLKAIGSDKAEQEAAAKLKGVGLEGSQQKQLTDAAGPDKLQPRDAFIR